MPPSASSPLGRIRELAHRGSPGEPINDDLACWLARSMQRYLERECRSVDEALGLVFPRGGIPWWREQANRDRDAALRELCQNFLSTLSPCAKARRVHALARRYAASSWRFDREREAMPAHYARTPHEHLWRAFKSGAPMPLGERHLRNILGG